jgi:septum formation protein
MERVVALAEDKARAAADRLSSRDPRLVLGADTLVCLQRNGEADLGMGKPMVRDEARLMIESLAGRDHFVHTGIALLDRSSGIVWKARSDSRVRFASMSADEIERYLDSEEWKDVAGAYRIQGTAAWFISRIEGSWSGIVGLPLRELYVILTEAGYRFRPIQVET